MIPLSKVKGSWANGVQTLGKAKMDNKCVTVHHFG